MRLQHDYNRNVFLDAKHAYLFGTTIVDRLNLNNKRKCKTKYAQRRLIDAMFPIIVDREVFLNKLNHDLPRIYRCINAVRKFKWYNADNDLVNVMVTAMALLDTDPHHKELKQIVHEYRVESEREWDGSRWNEYMQSHDNMDDYYPYSFILQESVLKWLFEQPKLRALLITLLDVYRHEKRLKGVEVKDQSIVEATKLQHVIQLLKGYVAEDMDYHVDGEHGLILMYVPAYNRWGKDELSFYEWKLALKHYQSVLTIESLWD